MKNLGISYNNNAVIVASNKVVVHPKRVRAAPFSGSGSGSGVVTGSVPFDAFVVVASSLSGAGVEAFNVFVVESWRISVTTTSWMAAKMIFY